MEIPSEIRKFSDPAKKILEKKGIGDVLFSEGTYEIEVKDGKTSFFPFVQIKPDGSILDSFCSCKEQEKEGACKHIAAAYLKIFEKNGKPLHLHFKSSFWKSLFEAIAKKASYNFESFKYKKSDRTKLDKYTLKEDDKEICSIEVKSAHLKKKFYQIYKSTRENLEESIKFSSLSFDDISLFKKGRVPEDLKFELSPFSDLAKELFFLQEEDKPYKVEFSPDEENIPSSIKVSFADIKAQLDLSEEDWLILIPSLNTIKSPLELFDFEKHAIKEILYNREATGFTIEAKEEIIEEIKVLSRQEGKSVGEWLFVPKKGFLSKTPSSFLEKKEIEEKEIPHFLEEHKGIFQKYLKNEKINFTPKKPRYNIFIDEQKNLHVCPYLFEKDDLFKKYSRFFGPWVYIEDKGFYLFENLLFNSKETIIPFDKVSEFVNHFRTWLQNIEGFETHFGNFEEEYVYYLTKDKDLKFEMKINLPEGLDKSIDFGNWIYIEGKGFFSKKEQPTLPIAPTTFVKNNCIDEYILQNEEDLNQIPHFFTEENPLQKYGVKIFINSESKIEVIPETVVEEGIDPADLIYFDNFIYVKNRGFFKLPYTLKIPPEYQTKTVIGHSDEPFFIEYELKRLKPFIISIDKDLEEPFELNIKLESLKKDRGAYLIEIYYESDFGKISAAALLQMLQSKKRFAFTKAGLIDTQDPRFNWLKDISFKKIVPTKNAIRINFLQWIRLCVFEDVKKPRGKSSKAIKTGIIFDELTNLQTDIPLDLSKLEAKLRPYQITGVKWLWFLYCYGLSGLLCDEMGLGKTHQAMALIAASGSSKKQKYLVVCPTSVIYHWEDLLGRFLPDFKVCTFHGISRELLQDYDILLTSYGIARSDNKKISAIKFDLSIFDEAQIAKNYQSKTYKALRKIRSNMIVGLTGTPIENRLRELKSLFDLILPHYLPSEVKFRDFFITPIEKDNNLERKKILSQLIRPFVLRRKKQEVLLDLPEKIEEVLHCDLSEAQKELYYQTAYLSKKEFLEELKDKSQPVRYVHIFSLLSKLKQICDHPVLINKDIRNYKKYQSGKWDLFTELLSEALESDQKVVVFTQYLDMIEIMKSHLLEIGVNFASITGSTKDRKEQIQKFKEEANCSVFLGSLLAAGVGIDLSCASIVIHYDRWWNPAKENQATDRVHRIGQSRGVQVLKLLTKNTIEERIHALIEKKQGLIEETIGKDDSEQIKTLSRDELIAVFQEIIPEKD